jgi:hypothetical protein
MDETISLKSNDFWVKVVEMLQQNWALVEEKRDGGVCVYFIGDTSGVFDELSFPSADEAIAALRRNGFKLFAGDESLKSFLHPSEPPYHR